MKHKSLILVLVTAILTIMGYLIYYQFSNPKLTRTELVIDNWYLVLSAWILAFIINYKLHKK